VRAQGSSSTRPRPSKHATISSSFTSPRPRKTVSPAQLYGADEGSGRLSSPAAPPPTAPPRRRAGP
jgi:hypothetical protein